MVQIAEWDSKFFGFSVGKIEIKSKDNFKDLITNSEGFKLIYVFSEVELNIPGIKLVDRKVIYEKPLQTNDQINLKEENGDIQSFDPEYHSYNQLLTLAHLSGTYSRFKLDSNIPDAYFFKMYKLWLDNSLKNEIAFETLVAIAEENISGFVTLGKKDSEISQIGLIAVNENYQGMKIGSRLLSKCENLSRKKGFSSLEVATQSDNNAACGLYRKNNFSIRSAQYIYHLWKK